MIVRKKIMLFAFLLTLNATGLAGGPFDITHRLTYGDGCIWKKKSQDVVAISNHRTVRGVTL